MNPIAKFVWAASRKARARRAELFRQYFTLDETTKILDLGSEDGTNIARVLKDTAVKPENVYIADINPEFIERGQQNYGFNPVLLDETGRLPFTDKFFELVYCSSVIEHVTVPKEDVWNKKIDFEKISWERQEEFAREINRAGRQYFVQTPASSFPIESHTWLPLVGYFPRPLLIPTLKLSNAVWVKQAIPDFHLLNPKQMARLFPGAEIVSEKKFGLTKSIMAIKSLKPRLHSLLPPED